MLFARDQQLDAEEREDDDREPSNDRRWEKRHDRTEEQRNGSLHEKRREGSDDDWASAMPRRQKQDRVQRFVAELGDEDQDKRGYECRRMRVEKRQNWTSQRAEARSSATSALALSESAVM